MPRVTIYGKESCPYTTRARDDFARRGYEVEYVDLREDASRIPEAMSWSGGRRAVPIIVEDGKGTVGFGGT